MAVTDWKNLRIGHPGEQAYDMATSTFNLAAPLTPDAAVTVRDVAQVRAAIDYARRHGLGVRPISTGHASAAEQPMNGELLIRTKIAGGVELDLGRRIARIPAGTRWQDVLAVTAPHSLVPAHGSSGDVGAVGYCLRGGVSSYGRTFGLASNSVQAVELVTADGELRVVDRSSDPGLFWALRGGGGGFGVVTSIHVKLFPVSSVVTGSTFWDGGDADAILPAWLHWSRNAPTAVTTSLRLLNLPSVPEVPTLLRGRSTVCIDGAIVCEPGADPAVALKQADALLNPLRRLANPILDDWSVTTPGAVLATHMDPPEPVPIRGDHMLLRDLDGDTVTAFLRQAGAGSGSPLVLTGLRQLGGALAVEDPPGGVLSHLDAALLYSGAGVPVDEKVDAAIGQRLRAIRSVLRTSDTGRTAPTFVESTSQPQRHLTPEQEQALDGLRARLDPHGLFAYDVCVMSPRQPVTAA